MRVVIVVLVLEVIILLTQFCFAGLTARRNPFKAIVTMMPAYLTALGTSSSAATILVTLRQTKKNGVSDAVASFTIPLCATIHLAGSTSKIFSAFAIVLTQGLTVSSPAVGRLHLHAGHHHGRRPCRRPAAPSWRPPAC